MRPLSVSQTIDAPREQVFGFLRDVANQSEFSDHYLGELRLERLDSKGVGASFSFRLKFPPAPWWGDLAVVELDPPHRIVMRGAMGRIGRIPIEMTYSLTTAGHGMTRVALGFESDVTHPVDRLKEALGIHFWMGLQGRRALRRLAAVIEHREPAGQPIRAAAG